MATPIVAPGGATTPVKGITFRPTGWTGYVHSSDGTVPASGTLLSIHAAGRVDEVDLSCIFGGHSCGMRFSTADARAVAAELIAAADAVERYRAEVNHG